MWSYCLGAIAALGLTRCGRISIATADAGALLAHSRAAWIFAASITK